MPNRCSTIAWYGVALSLALVTCLAAISPFVPVPGWTTTIPVSFKVDARTFQPVAPPGGDVQLVGAHGFGFETVDENGVSTRPQFLHVRGAIRIPAQQSGVFWKALLFLMVLLALVLWVLGQLRAVFRTLRDGQPFVPANATRIRWIACGVIAGELVRAAIVFFENYYADDPFLRRRPAFRRPAGPQRLRDLHGLIILVDRGSLQGGNAPR